MTDFVFWAIVFLMIGWHTPAPFWATWLWNWGKSQLAKVSG